MGGRGPKRRVPAGMGGPAGAAIDHQAVGTGAEFESEEPGMGMLREFAFGDLTAIDLHNAAPRRQPLIAAVTGMLKRLAAGAVARQQSGDGARIAFQSAVEKRQCAVTMA